MSTIVSHDTSLMQNWSNTMQSNNSDYESLVRELYSLVEEFANSNDFKGGLSTNFLDTFLGRKQAFLDFAQDFNECSEYIKARARDIESDESYLKSKIESNNPLQ